MTNIVKIPVFTSGNARQCFRIVGLFLVVISDSACQLLRIKTAQLLSILLRAGRHVGGHQDAARDVMSPVCQRRHSVRAVSFDHHRFPSSPRNGTDGWRQLVLADRKVPVPELAAFRVDFGHWFQMRSLRDRSIISALIAGEQPSSVADRFGISRGRVSQLRRRYEREWRVFQGEVEKAA
jgi:hypothetical protein